MFFCSYKFRFFWFSFFLVFFFACGESYGGIWDCFWGGANEETAYTTPLVHSGTSLAQTNQPPMNIGAPLPSIPIQATPATRATLVPQPNIPTISPITGNVGTIGQPAANSAFGNTALPPQNPAFAPQTQFNNQPIPNNTALAGNRGNVEILYVLPSNSPDADVCIGGEQGTPAVASRVVAAGTPGAIPVVIQTITAYKPRVEYRLRFAPMKQKTETLVNVIDPRTRRVVKSYCQTGERQITTYPVVHWEEVVGYEAVTVKMGTPVNQNYPQNYNPTLPPQNTNPIPAAPTTHKTLYLDQQDNQTFSTEIY
ncbi:MAG: hypothetical protein LBJ00_12315 [Planctomycetaceae bacterium]|jgi:hypothetical protein|nr:hypothetical protein [Planctomycetaceae bacterium]